MNRFESHDGRRLAFDACGAGKPVLCLAGLTRNMRDFDSLAAHLSDRYRVIRLDARGRGGSEHAREPIHEYAVPVESQDAVALLDHLGIPRAAVIGTSRGGILGMAMAAGRPGLVPALVLNDVGAVVEMAGLLRIAAYLGRAPRDPSFEAAAERLSRENRRQFPDVPVARWLVHAHAIYDEEDGRPRLSYDPRLRAAVAALDEELPHVSLWPLFESLHEVPILVIRGAHSDILTQETLEAMAEHHPGLEAVEIPGRGHAPFLDEPEAVAAIDRFLGEHWA